MLDYLPAELIHSIASHLSDPCDLQAFLRTSRRQYLITSPLFSSRFSHLKKGRANIVDFRKNDLVNWYEPEQCKPTPSCDSTVLAARQLHLERCSLAWSALENGWHRLFRRLTQHCSVPGSATVLLRRWAPCRIQVPDAVRPQAQCSLLVEAVFRGEFQLVKHLVEVCATRLDCWGPDLRDGSRRHVKSELSYVTPLLAAIIIGREDIASYLVSRGASVVLSNLNGENPVITSVLYHRTEIVSLLLHQGAPACSHDTTSQKGPVRQATPQWQPRARHARRTTDRGHQPGPAKPMGLTKGERGALTCLLGKTRRDPRVRASGSMRGSSLGYIASLGTRETRRILAKGAVARRARREMGEWLMHWDWGCGRGH